MSLFDSNKPISNLDALKSLAIASAALLISSMITLVPAHAKITYITSVNHNTNTDISSGNAIDKIGAAASQNTYVNDALRSSVNDFNAMVLPQVFNEVISAELNGLSLADVLYVMAYDSGYDIVVSRDLDDVILHNTSYTNTPIRHIVIDIMQKNNLTYSYIGDDLLFIYRDSDYNKCMFNMDIWKGKLLDKSSTGTSTSKPLSINVSQLELSTVFKLISEFTDYQILVDNRLLSSNSTFAIDLDRTTESIHLTNTSIDQVLTILAYRNNFDYRYIGNDKIIIVPSRNLEQCQSVSKQVKEYTPAHMADVNGEGLIIHDRRIRIKNATTIQND